MKKEDFAKRFIAVLFASVLMLGAFQPAVIAVHYENGFSFSDGGYTFEIDGGKAIIIAAPEKLSGAVEIPSSVQALGSQLDVAGIGKEVFKNNTQITEISFPKSVTAVGEAAFEGCSGLREVTFRSDLAELGNGVFSGCVSLEKITLPKNLFAVADRAFYGCRKLEKISLPQSVFSIGAMAFCASAITSIELPAALASIGENAFFESALEEINIPGEVRVIEREAFACCPLKAVTLSKGIREIKDLAFANTLLSSVAVPESVSLIGEKAFAFCRLSSVIMDAMPGTIEENSFFGNENENNHLVFYGRKTETGSAVEKYAKENGYAFETLSCGHDAKSFAIIPKVEADCVLDGHQKGVYCFECTAYISGGDIIRSTGHRMVVDPDIDATCTSFGVIGRKHCTVCGLEDGERRQTPKRSHAPETVVSKKASFSSDGEIKRSCILCGEVFSRSVIPKVDAVYVSHSEFIYNGKVITPSVTVRDSSGKTLKKGVDYTLTYSKGRKQTGKYSVTVTLKGKNRTGKKVLFFSILPPAVAKLSVSLKNNTLSAKWEKSKGATGYRVYLFKENSFVTSVDTVKTNANFKELSKGVKYKLVVRAYKKFKNEKLLSSHSSGKIILTTPTAPTNISAKSKNGAVTLRWSEQKYATGYIIYVSRNPDYGFEKLATVKGDDNTVFTVKKGLKKGQTYYFRLKTYKKAKKVDAVRSPFSKTVSVKVK